jgi:hypothetical protein
MKVLAKKGAVLLVIMKVNLQNKNILAIFLAYLYNDSESLAGKVSSELSCERVSSCLSGEMLLATTSYISPSQVLPSMLQRGVREKTWALLLWAVNAKTKRRLSCH